MILIINLDEFNLLKKIKFALNNFQTFF